MTQDGEENQEGGDGNNGSTQWYLHHFECNFALDAKVKAKVLGIVPLARVLLNGNVDISCLTQYFNNIAEKGEGPCDKGEQKTCNDAWESVKSQLDLGGNDNKKKKDVN